MSFRLFVVLLVALPALWPTSVLPQSGPTPPKVHLIWMGGNDCPPCLAWRAIELPLLRKSPEFQSVQYSYVVKAVDGSVPPRMFLPNEVKEYKDILDVASNGGHGSPQAALIVNGEVFDYFWGARTASEIESMLAAVRTGSQYPFRRCVKMHSLGRSCEIYKL